MNSLGRLLLPKRVALTGILLKFCSKKSCLATPGYCGGDSKVFLLLIKCLRVGHPQGAQGVKIYDTSRCPSTGLGSFIDSYDSLFVFIVRQKGGIRKHDH